MIEGEYLIIDEGNTRCKAVVFKDDTIIWSANEPNLEKIKFTNVSVKKSLFSSVRRTETPKFLLNQFPHLYHWKKNNQLPFASNYSTPETLGKDRIANILALIKLAPKNISKVSIDIGSCITYEVVDDKNVFLGGRISPGYQMRSKAMHNYTGQLPLIDLMENSLPIGDSTESCMIAGVMHGVQAEIDTFIEEQNKKMGTVHYFITGGDAKYFDFHEKNYIFANQNLTLIGLKEILIHS